MEPKQHESEINFQKYWLVLRRRWLPASGVFGVILLLTSVIALRQEPIYEAESKLLFKSSRASTLTGLGEGIGELETLTVQNNPLDTQAEVVRSVPVLQEVIQTLDLKDKNGKPLKPDDLAKNLVVKAVGGTEVMQLSYKDPDPKLAATIVNKVADVFIRNNLQVNRGEAVAARKFIAEQLPKTELAVREADNALRQFKQSNNVVVLAEEASATVTVISNLQQQIAEANAQLADVTAQSRRLQSQVGSNPQQAVLYATLSQASGVQDVLPQLQQAQRELAVAQTRFVSGPPIEKIERRVEALNALLKERVAEIAGNQSQIPIGNLQLGKTGDDLVPQIVRTLIETEAQRVGLTERLNALSKTYSLYRERAKVLPSLERTERELQRRLDAAQKTYEALLTKLQETQVAENQNVGNARIISPALVPDEATASKKKLILGAGALAGIFLGIATAFLLDLIDRSIKTLGEAKELFGYTVLGVIPAYNHQSSKLLSKGRSDLATPRVVLGEALRSPVKEAFQMLQANLKFSASDHPLKTIVVTSAVMAEGKSFVAANLAATAAQMGQKVLLVDADLRCPVQHHVWDVISGTGLSNVIVEQVDTKEAIQEVAPNLFLLPSGVIPPNPIALFDSNRMKSLVDILSNVYDLVIFDSPPLAGKADSAVLGKIVDGVLLVVRPGVVDSSSAYAAKEFLTQSGQAVLGMVINGVNIRNEPDSYFYYTRDDSANRELKSQALNITR